MTAGTDVFGEIRDEIRAVGMDHTLSAAERSQKLSALREPLADALGELDTYRAQDEGLREAESSSGLEEVAWARRNAWLRDELIGMGELTEASADSIGLLSNAELDRLEEEGLLLEAAAGIAARWAEQRKAPESPLPQAPPPKPGAPRGFGQPQSPADEDPAMKQQRDVADERMLGSLTDYVHASSQQAESLATGPITSAVQENGGTMQGLDQRLKPKASIRAKVKRRRDTMPLASDQERAQIPDGARYTAVFPAASYVQGVERTLGALEQAGFKRLESHNSWGDPDWAGLMVVLRSPGGQPVEVVLHTDESARAMKLNAPIVARFCRSTDPHERYKMWHDMAANVANVPAPKGAEQLGDTTSQPAAAGPDGIPTTGPDSFHSVVGAHELQPGDRAQDPLHGGVVSADGPPKTVASVNDEGGGTTVGWHDGSRSKFQPGSTVKKLRGGDK